MSLMSTLAKVAIGVAVAKGVGSMMKGSGGGLLNGGAAPSGSGQASGQAGGGLGDILGQVLGGQSGGSGSNMGKGGLGGLLESLGGSMPSGQANAAPSGGAGQSGGLGDLLGQLTGAAGGGAAAGGIGGILGNLLKQAQQGQSGGGSFGDVLNQSFAPAKKAKVQPTVDQEAVAALMLRAMIQAAKSDGQLDDGEREKLMANLGDASQDEMAFVQHELAQPVDIAGLARQVPEGLQQQVYAMSVMAIDLDSQAEAQYLHQLAQTLSLDQSIVNAMHDKLGVQRLYS